MVSISITRRRVATPSATTASIGCNGRDRQRRVELLHLARQRRTKRVRRRRGLDDQIHDRRRRPLVREIHGRPGGHLHPLVPHVADNPDDAVGTRVVPADDQLAAERVFIGEDGLGECVVDDERSRLRAGVCGQKCPPMAKRDPHRAEVVAADDTDLGDRFLAGRRCRVSDHREAGACANPGDWKEVDGAGRLDAWQGGEPLDQLLEELRLRRSSSYRSPDSETRAVRTPLDVNPGSTSSTRIRLRIRSADPASSTTASAISAMTRPRRRRSARPDVAARLESRRVSVRSTRVASSAGSRPATRRRRWRRPAQPRQDATRASRRRGAGSRWYLDLRRSRTHPAYART